ncbi:transglutaminaseTgpA domain-containing protein [Agrococcus sediminis]|uniref:transglutaminaseTgpA domain-containing protein n=1 Tax=Agrococcus sediminis TaxID=2599924 RepID=UPI0037F72F9E
MSTIARDRPAARPTGAPAGVPPRAELPAEHGRRRLRAGPVETVALAVLPVAWLWSTQEVLGQDWLWPVVGAVVSMALVAGLVRAVWPAFAGTAAAALVGVGWVTAVSAPDEALLGVIPTPEALRATMAVLGEGVQSIAWALSTPIDAEGAVLAAVVAAAVVLTVFVDLLGHGLRAPAIAVLCCAVALVLPIAFRIDVPWFHALPGVAAAALALAAPTIDDRVALGRGWVAPVALVAVAAVLAAAVPLMAPSPRESTLDLPTIEDLLRPTTPVLRTDIDLGDELRRPEARPVFTYSTTDGGPIVTRLMTLPHAGPDGFLALPPEAAQPSPLVEGADLGLAMQMTVRMSDVRAEGLPTPERASGVEPPEGARWDDANDALRIEGSLETAGLEYVAAGSRSTPLAELSGTASTGHDELLALPDAAAAIGRQGAALVQPGMTAAERVRAVHAFMTEGVWDYSEQLDLPGFGGAGGDGWAALEAFLETRSGYCVHYASATAALLRGAGVPTRVVVGFLPGSEISGGFAVSTNDMHAWAESWVDGHGWVRVETTPGAGTGDSSPSPEDDEQTQAPTPTPEPTPTDTAPTSTPTPSAAPSPGAPEPGASEAPGEGTGPGGIDPAVLRAWLLGIGALLLLALPWAVRQAQRVVRLRRGAPGAWQELRAALADAGVRLPASATPGDLQAAIAARVPPEAAAAADRVRLAAERAAFAGGPREPGACDADVRIAARGLVASLPPWRRALSTALPPSLLRVVPPLDAA